MMEGHKDHWTQCCKYTQQNTKIDLMDGTARTQSSDPVPLSSDAWVPGGILLGRHFLIVVEFLELFPVPDDLGVHGVNIPILGIKEKPFDLNK